jgi:cytoskeletal protein RodZ
MPSSQINLIDTTVGGEQAVVNTVEELIARRNQLGMSLETLAQQLRLPLKQLQLIDSGQFSEMSSLAYARAVLRSYGKAVGVDASPITRQVGTFAEAAELHNVSNTNQPVESRGMMGFGQAGSGSKWAWGGLVVAAIALAAFFLGPKQKELQRVGESLMSKSDTKREATATTSSESVAVKPEVSGATKTGVAAAVAVPPPTHADLKFEVKSAAWVEVTQVVDGAETTQVFSHSGSDVQNFLVNVKLPAKVVIGNAEAVRVLRDGKELDTKAQTQSSLAKLTIE